MKVLYPREVECCCMFEAGFLGAIVCNVIRDRLKHFTRNTRHASLESPENFSAPKSHLYRQEPLILQHCHFNMCLRPENFDLRKFSGLETSLFTRYSVNYRARNRPEKFRGF